MKLVISPAKSLDLDSKLPTNLATEASFLKEAKQISTLLKKQSAKELSQLMRISDNLGQLNYERNQEWNLPFTKDNARPAVYAFNGDVYRGLDAYTISEEKIEDLQNTVRILSGLYGILKPLDLVQAYRLEMGTKFPVGKNKNLYEFWKTQLTASLNNELKDDEVFVNLASNEYFKAIDTKVLKVPVTHIKFLEFKNGKHKVIAIFSKLARGLMARFIVETNAQTVDDLKAFTAENYGYSETLSSEHELVFTR